MRNKHPGRKVITPDGSTFRFRFATIVNGQPATLGVDVSTRMIHPAGPWTVFVCIGNTMPGHAWLNQMAGNHTVAEYYALAALVLDGRLKPHQLNGEADVVQRLVADLRARRAAQGCPKPRRSRRRA